MPDASSFSPDYTTARDRFRRGAAALGFSCQAHPIGQQGPDGQDLTIDVAILGSADPANTVVVTSATHGVEGFMGSAVQAALFEDRLKGWTPPADARLVLIHAVNPYGFAWIRRVNEDNADLNRNFLLDGDKYVGSPDGYERFDALLNPPTAPGGLEFMLPRMAYLIARYGMRSLMISIASGQYDHPAGLFFGGHAPAASHRLFDEHLLGWVGPNSRVLHVDFHTGLGDSATYKLLIDHKVGSERAQQLSEWFGDDAVQPWGEGPVAYQARGGLGAWCRQKFDGRSYDLLAAEFGTVPPITVIRALRQENRAHLWGQPSDPGTVQAKKQLLKVFAPPQARWRDAVVQSGVRIVDQAMQAIL
jgi:hypothetical protein